MRGLDQNVIGSSLSGDGISQIDFPVAEFFECLIWHKEIDIPGAGGGCTLVIFVPPGEPLLDLSSGRDREKESFDWVKKVSLQTLENEFPSLVCGQANHILVDFVVYFDGVSQDFQILNLERLNVRNGFSVTEFNQIRIIKVDTI